MKNCPGKFNKYKTKFEHTRCVHSIWFNVFRLFHVAHRTPNFMIANFSRISNVNVSRFDGTTSNCVPTDRYSHSHSLLVRILIHTHIHTHASRSLLRSILWTRTIETVSGIKWHRWKLCHLHIQQESSPFPPLAGKWQMQSDAETSNGSLCVWARGGCRWWVLQCVYIRRMRTNWKQ